MHANLFLLESQKNLLFESVTLYTYSKLQSYKMCSFVLSTHPLVYIFGKQRKYVS